jgi:hypothetical protein
MIRCMILAVSFALGIASAARANIVTTTFEDLGLPPNSFNNNAGPSGQFVSGGNSFNNSYDPTYDAWSGWAISSKTDVTTPGFTNQYSAITGSGANGSATYAVADPFGPTANAFHPADSFINLAAGASPVSIQVTNTTYAYLSMKLGDSFAHAFGPGDYFLLDIKGYNGTGGTGQVVGEVDFYLANFLGDNSYIINTWQTLDLTSLVGATSLGFGLQSSDNDPTFGMNTPAYFAADNLRLNAVPEPSTLVLSLGWLFVALRRNVPYNRLLAALRGRFRETLP